VSTVPADWYVNPEDPSQWRYWDGEAWTDHTAPRVKDEVPSPSGGSEPDSSAPLPISSDHDELESEIDSCATEGLEVEESSSPYGLKIPPPLDYRQPGGKKPGGSRWSRLMRGIDAANDLVDVMEYHNKCIYCGKRLKYAEYAVITGSGKRMKTCRGCGRDQPEQPSMTQVFRSFNQPRKIFVDDGPLPLCKTCQVSVMVAAEGSHVFCRECQSQWAIDEVPNIRSTDDLTDEMRNWFPIPRDESPVAELVRRHITALGYSDWSSAVLIMVDEATRNGNEYFHYVAAMRDRLEYCDAKIGVEQFAYLDIDPDQSNLDSGHLRLAFRQGRELEITTELADIFLNYLDALRQVRDAASVPYTDETDSHPQSGQHALDALERLASLHKDGLLTDEEFQQQKAKILKRI
jgi:hypothetical protein